MSIPSFDGCIHPLLRTLAAHPSGVRTREAIHGTADALGITEGERRLMLPSGGDLLYRNRIAWAHHHLKAAGLSSSPRWGVWKITPKGSDALRDHPGGFDAATLKKLIAPGLVKKDADSGAVPARPAPTSQVATPEEQIGAAMRQIEQGIVGEVRELLARGSAEFFERVVLHVLRAMGYGAGGGEVLRVGGVGDGGIDGVITLDRLGLQKVGVQAKRWKGSVGRPDVQAFYGALAQRRAHHGVMITTSSFSNEAQEFAEQMSDKIVLIDGKRLARLMLEYGVGVSHDVLRIPKVDRDYFEDA